MHILKDSVNNTTFRRLFLDCVDHVYAYDPQYIRHRDEDIDRVFDPAQNTLHKYGGCERWVVIQHQKPVGRIAAFYHHENDKKPFAGIGFFESIPDEKIATLLFKTATDWFKQHHIRHIIGPVNFGDRDGFWGLLISSQSTPSFRENYHPPYYQAFFENYGFEKKFEQITWKINPSHFDHARFDPIFQRVKSRYQLETRHFTKKYLKQFAADFTTIYNKAWALHPDYRPKNAYLVEKSMKSMLSIAPEELNIFLYIHQKPVAFSLNILDINPLIKNGKISWWTKCKFALGRYTLTKLRGVVFGIVPEYWNKGFEMALIIQLHNALRSSSYRHITEFELSWVGDFNPRMLGMLSTIGAEVSKTHYTYKLDLK
jgi:hypothetical protein